MKCWADLKYAIVLLMLPIAGCSLGRSPNSQVDCQPRSGFSSGPVHVIAPKMPAVATDFANVPVFTDVRRNIIETNEAQDSITLNLDESICLAAQHAPLARVIDDQRRRIECRLGTENHNSAIDVFLEAQAIEQRNKAAGNAGELFLRLVEIQLQQQLLHETSTRHREFESTLSTAQQAGLATATARGQLDAQAIVLQRKWSDLEIARQEVVIKLKTLIGMESTSMGLLQPRHELAPHDVQLNLRNEIAIALANRPELVALQDISARSNDGRLDNVLSQLAPALGMDVTQPLKKRILKHHAREDEDPSQSIRNQQLQQIFAARQQQVEIEVAESVLKIQNNLQQIALDGEDLQRLAAEMKLAESKSEIDAKESFVDSIRIWAEQQQIRSNRISTAIQLEVAQVRLLEAQGQLTSQCGFPAGFKDPCICR